MRTILTTLSLTLAAVMPAGAATFTTLSGAAPIVIAHRGASGYEPEHTLAAYELAARLGADYIEPDVVITSDGVAIALHDTSLNRTTDVEALFAPRGGGYEAANFTLAEIKTLTVDYGPATPVSQSAIPDFVPTSATPFAVPTLQEVVDLVTTYNADNGTDIGLYPELKTADPDLNRIIVGTLIDAGLSTAADKVYIQSFDLQTLRDVALVQAELGSDIRQIALGAARVEDGIPMLIRSLTEGTPLGEISAFVDGIGPSLFARADLGVGVTSDFVRLAHGLGLEVHPYTFNEPDPEAAYAEFASYFNIGIDGFFTNYTDVARDAIARYEAMPAPVPLPASGLLILAGIAGLGAFRRRAAR